MHTNSKALFTKYAAPLFGPQARVLEIGPNGFPSSYQKLVSARDLTWHTLDIFGEPRLTYQNSPEYEFAIPDNAYDLVLAGNVIEHVKKPWRWIRELGRVCRPGGRIVIITPVSWPYHPAPVDCWRIYPDGMRSLLEDAGLGVEECRFESLEMNGYARYTPGTSAECQSGILRWFFRLTGPLGFPVERAYDTVAIANKVG
jgi:SAM-dependent methyltransferase